MFKRHLIACLCLSVWSLGCDDESSASADLGGAPLMDSGVPDMRGISDAEVSADLSPPDMATPDMATPDMAAPDMAAPDMATPDMATPDMAALDAATVDMAVDPDMGEPDPGSPDMAVPPPDEDGDGVADAEDDCPAVPNPEQRDLDRDGQGDACDLDGDGDGVADADEVTCGTDPLDANSRPADADQDGVCDHIDNCPEAVNPDQSDRDGDGRGNVCDEDSDGDGAADDVEVDCGSDPLDGASVPVDGDEDGVCDPLDACPAVPEPAQRDTDADGQGDACDDDDDGDGAADAEETACGSDPLDAASVPPDPDEDGLCDALDNCPVSANPDQADRDGDGAGDACDPNLPPSLQGVQVVDGLIARDGTFECRAFGYADPEDDPEQVEFSWIAPAAGGAPPRLLGRGPTLDATGLFPDTVVRCTGFPVDSLGEQGDPVVSNNVGRVTNRPPAMAQVRVLPEAPSAEQTLLCNASATDVDDDAYRFEYQWLTDQGPIPGATGPSLDAAELGGQAVRCEAIPYDAFDWGDGAVSAPVQVAPAPPVIEAVQVQAELAASCAEMTCAVTLAGDPEGVTLSYQWLVDGLPAGGDAPTFQSDGLLGGEAVRCRATASNASGAGETVLSSAYRPVNGPPAVESAQVPGAIGLGELITCTAAGATDDCSRVRITYGWLVNGELTRQGRSPRFVTEGLPAGSVVECVATPSDGLLEGAPARSNLAYIVGDGFGLEGDTERGLAGTSVAVIDDLDGDGLAEVVVGAPNTTVEGRAQAGQIYVVYGNEAEAVLPLAAMAQGEGGFVVAGVGGSYPLYNDLCRNTGIAQCPTLTDAGDERSESAWNAGPAGDGLGTVVAFPGDVDGDGQGDVLVTAPYARVFEAAYSGTSHVLSGLGLSEGTDLAEAGTGWTLEGECGRRRTGAQGANTVRATNGDLAGWAAEGAGDVNGDGLADLIIGAPNSGDLDDGTAYVVYGQGESESLRLSAVDARTCRRGAPDLPERADDALGFGITDSHDRQFNPHWGYYVGGVGDVDGDGYDDVMVGALQSGSSNSFIVLGGETQPDVDLNALDPEANRVLRVQPGFIRYTGVRDEENNLVLTLDGALPVGQRGGGGGDVNGDGLSDVALTMFRGRGDADGQFSSVGVLFDLPEGGLNYHARAEAVDRGLWIEGPEVLLDSKGGPVRINGDLNGDGFDDLVVGVPLDATDAGPEAGRVYVAFGGPEARIATFAELREGVGGFAVDGTQAGERFGWSLDVADVDGDGLADLVVGAPRYDTADHADAGRVQVVLGRNAGGAITGVGTPGDDALDGVNDQITEDVLVGGRGDDLIRTGDGPDVVYAGAGDDEVRTAGRLDRRLDGGRGDDLLMLNVAGDTSMAAWRGRIRGFERIQLGTGNQALQITRRDLLRQSASSNRLYVTGDQNDVVVSEAEAWFSGEPVEEAGQTWRVLTSGRAELYLAEAVQTRFDPYVLPQTFELDENPALGTVVGQVEAGDPDGEVDRIELLPGDHDGRYTVAADGTIRVNAALDFESPDRRVTLTLRVTDAEGLSAEGEVQVRLRDVNEPPRFMVPDPFEVQIGEGGYDNTLVASVLAIDPDRDEVLTYALVGDDVGPFSVDARTGDLRITGGLDFEGQALFVLGLTVTDARGLTDQRTVRVRVTDRDTFPQRYTLSFAVQAQPIQSPGDACWVSPFAFDVDVDRPAGGTPPVTIPNPFNPSRIFAADLTGNYSISFASVPDRGRYDGVAVTEVVLELPDEVAPGDIPIRYVSRPIRTAVSGRSPGYGVRGETILRDSRFASYNCAAAPLAVPNFDPDSDCDLLGERVLDLSNGDLPEVYRRQSQAEPLPFAAVSDEANPDRAETRVQEGFFEFEYSIISWAQWAQQILGIPNVRSARMGYQVGQMLYEIESITFDYAATIANTFRTRAGLHQRGVYAVLVLEDGSRLPLTIPTCAQQAEETRQACREDFNCLQEADTLQLACEAGDTLPTSTLHIPAGADQDGDGLVRIEAEFRLWADVTSEFQLQWNLGGYVKFMETTTTETDISDPEDPVSTVTDVHGPEYYRALTLELMEDCPSEHEVVFPLNRRIGAVDLVSP